jgi:hypothetical protein
VVAPLVKRRPIRRPRRPADVSQVRSLLSLPLAQMAVKRLGRLVSERHARDQHPLADDVGDVLVQIDVVELELGQLVEPHPGNQEIPAQKQILRPR